MQISSILWKMDSKYPLFLVTGTIGANIQYLHRQIFIYSVSYSTISHCQTFFINLKRSAARRICCT